MMRIGELAKKVGITTQAIRYYERIGLFENHARNASGYRIYEDHAVDFLKFVKKAQSLGFNLQEIKTIWNMISSGKKPCGYVLKQTEKRQQYNMSLDLFWSSDTDSIAYIYGTEREDGRLPRNHRLLEGRASFFERLAGLHRGLIYPTCANSSQISITVSKS